VTFWFHDRASAKYIVELLVALRGDEKRAAAFPLCYPFLEPISPLRFPQDGIDLLYETARLNLPVPIGPMAQMGLSAPGTVAGTLAQENAEILAGVCLTQLIRPGMPVCYGGICHAFDMRTTQMIFAGPEQAIFGVAMTQMGKRYGLPVYINVGLTDAKRPTPRPASRPGDARLRRRGRRGHLRPHGHLRVDQAASLDMLVLQNEVIRYVESALRRSMSRMRRSASTSSTRWDRADVHRHRAHGRAFPPRALLPRLLDRQYHEAWREAGSLSMEDRCRSRKQEILASHQVEPVSAEVDKALAEIVSAARRELRG